MGNDSNNIDDEQRRESRHKRRVRQRVVAFIWLLLIVSVLTVAGIVLWGKFGNQIQAKLSKLGVGKTESSADVTGEPVTPQPTGDDVQQIIEELLAGEDDIVVGEPSPTPTPLPTEQEYEDNLNETIAAMSLEDKVAALIITTPEQLTGADRVTQAGEGTKKAWEDTKVGGLIYDIKNYKSDEQFVQMLSNANEYANDRLMLIAREGLGDNSVWSKAVSGTTTKNPLEIGNSLDPYNAYFEAASSWVTLKKLGFNANFGLSLSVIPEDVASDKDEADDTDTDNQTEDKSENSNANQNGENSDGNDTNELSEYTFSFGNDPDMVGKMLYQEADAAETLKLIEGVVDFPTIGEINNETGYKSSEYTIEDIANREGLVLKNAVMGGVDCVIVSHLTMPNAITDAVPASLSKEIMTDLIRETLELHDIIVITDEMNKPEITDYYTSAEAAVKAIKAGADMVMCPENLEEAINGVIEAVNSGVISEERINMSLKRIFRVRDAIKDETSDIDTTDTETNETEENPVE